MGDDEAADFLRAHFAVTWVLTEDLESDLTSPDPEVRALAELVTAHKTDELAQSLIFTPGPDPKFVGQFGFLGVRIDNVVALMRFAKKSLEKAIPGVDMSTPRSRALAQEKKRLAEEMKKAGSGAPKKGKWSTRGARSGK